MESQPEQQKRVKKWRKGDKRENSVLGLKNNSSATQGVAHTGYEVDISTKSLKGSVW